MPLFLAFLIVPLIEIGLFIQIGGLIGLWPTLLIVILTALLGTYLVRSQGLQVLNQLRGAFENLNDPTEPLAHGAMILFSGALLLTPGFFTDAVGFALLVPSVRGAVFRQIRSRISMRSAQYGSTHSSQSSANRPNPDPTIIDAEFEDLDAPGPKGPSGWTRH
jgi:UPF0716 protein FxsA